MSYDIRPLAPEDIPPLSRFLTEGFGTAPDAPFASPDVLRWKYFDPIGDGGAPRSWVAWEEGQLIGHLGLCPTTFVGAADEIPTAHMIDWLSTRPGSGVGARLMLRAHQGIPTGYGFGGSAAGRAVIGGGGFKLVAMVPVYQRTLRLGAAWRAGRMGRAAKDLWRALARRPQRPRTPLALAPVAQFVPEIAPVLDDYRRLATFTDRRPALLNHLLRYPRGGITGWLIQQGERVRGFGLLSLVGPPHERAGKIVDCVLDDRDPALWHAATFALTDELKHQGAVTATAFASTDWSATALRACGFVTRHALEFRLRDKGNLIPGGTVFHLSALEADYAYN